MNKNIILIITSFFLLTCNVEAAQSKYHIKDIKKFGDIINIAGGRIPHDRLKNGQVWGNICFVISNPLEEDLSVAEWIGRKKYPLKETYMQNFNEAQVYYTFATIIRYYILNAHSIAKKSPNEEVKIVVHIHRNSSAESFIKYIQETIKDSFPELARFTQEKNVFDPLLFNRIHLSSNVTVDYRYGYLPNSLIDYKDANIVLSISPVASINQNLQPGTIVTPTHMVPMSLDSMTVMASREYKVSNHIVEVADKIIQSQDARALSVVNNRHLSPNPLKRDLKAELIKKDIFLPTGLIQVDGYFNPKLLPSYFYIIE
ncbi:MAG: hypothetical protein K0R02_28 [Rickettsiaceae bacterium]|jgi:hypothetical protein|nr:hypothetical protein [Rickettsiaceae bacterium]